MRRSGAPSRTGCAKRQKFVSPASTAHFQQKWVPIQSTQQSEEMKMTKSQDNLFKKDQVDHFQTSKDLYPQLMFSSNSNG